MTNTPPNFEKVGQIIRDKFSEEVVRAERFPTGHCHFVFDVETAGGRRLVVRIAQTENRHLLGLV